MKLRDYQTKLIKGAYKVVSLGKFGIVLVSPTGSGKMVTLTFIAKNSPHPILLLFHVRELCKQCMGELDNWGVSYHKIISGMDEGDVKSNITVAMMQTYISRKDKIKHKYKRIIIDEGHHVKASTYTKIFDLMPDAKRLAFTATPIRLDGSGLVDNIYFDEIVFGPQPSELVKRGFLAPIRLFTQTPADLNLDSIKVTAGDYNIKELSKLMENSSHGKIVGDNIKYYRKYCDGKPALACCASIRHAELVAEEFNKSGIKAVAVSGKTKDRDKIMEAYTAGEIKLLSYAQVFGEGVDLPDAVAMFYMRPSKSLVTWKQNCGRVARIPYKGKVSFVFDCVGQAYTNFAGEQMGHPYKDTNWLEIIYNQQNKKKKTNAKQPDIYDRCDECLEIYPANLKVCPECGYNNISERKARSELERIEGELKEQEELDNVLSKTLHEITSLKEMHTYARATGKSSGWAFMVWKNKFRRSK